jgi:hypothetical protein
MNIMLSDCYLYVKPMLPNPKLLPIWGANSNMQRSTMGYDKNSDIENVVQNARNDMET